MLIVLVVIIFFENVTGIILTSIIAIFPSMLLYHTIEVLTISNQHIVYNFPKLHFLGKFVSPAFFLPLHMLVLTFAF